MGLTTWKNAPAGPIRKGDVDTAKNYLSQQEITELNRIVTMYLDYAEDQAQRHNPMHMADWLGKLDAFLQFNERNILTHAGKFSAEEARRIASHAFNTFDANRRQIEAQQDSNFDRAVKRLARKPKSDDKPDAKETE